LATGDQGKPQMDMWALLVAASVQPRFGPRPQRWSRRDHPCGRACGTGPPKGDGRRSLSDCDGLTLAARRPPWGCRIRHRRSGPRAVPTQPRDRSSAVTRGGRGLNYARRQQYRRLLRAAGAGTASVGAVALAPVVAGAGAVSAAGVLLVLALGFALYARHWLSLAGRSGVGARTRSGTRLRRFGRRGGGYIIRCHGGGVGTSTRWRLRLAASGSWSKPRPGATTTATLLACVTRRRGSPVGDGDGAVTARWPSCVLCGLPGWSASSGMSSWFSIDRLVPALSAIASATRSAGCRGCLGGRVALVGRGGEDRYGEQASDRLRQRAGDLG
jgi:hypothetical protein